jgi:hypothetical protein
VPRTQHGIGAAAAILLLPWPGEAAADEVLLRPVADATLIEEPAGAWANGSGARLFAGRVGANAGSTRRRGLLRFDLGALPPGSVVQSASLALTLERSRQAGDLPFALHRATQSWTEGPSASVVGIGEPSQTGDVTWLHRRKPDLTWTSPGGDFVAQASATQRVGSTSGTVTWSSTPALVADVQAWVDQPTANHGWVLIGFEGPLTSAKGFATREAGAVADQPGLRVIYEPGATQADEADIPLPGWMMALFGLGLAATVARPGRPDQGCAAHARRDANP